MTEPVRSEARIVAILTNDDGEILPEGRIINGKENKYGNRPLFKLKHQELVPIADYRALAAKVEELEAANQQWLLDLATEREYSAGAHDRFEGLNEQITTLQQQLAAARLECAEHKERALRVLRRDFTQICSYCGWEATREGAKWEDLQAHIHTCPQHPIMTLQARVRVLEEALHVIASYDRRGTGCCDFGCDTPTIAKKALAPGGRR